MRQMRTPSEANGCYGYLVWVNGKPCTGPTFPSRQTVDVAPFEGFPDDAFATVGFLQQNNFLIPSLGLQVTWNGAFGDQSPDPGTVLSANVNSELYRTFLRMVVGAYTDQQVPDPGAYSPTFNLDFDPMQTLNPDVFLSSFGAGPDAPKDCDFFRCGDTPLRAPFQDNPGCFVLACAPRGTGN